MKIKIDLLIIFLLTLGACRKNNISTPDNQKLNGSELVSAISGKATKIEDLKTFAPYLNTLELSDEEASDGVTVFAPVDAAFSALESPQTNTLKTTSVSQALPDGSSIRDYIIKGLFNIASLSEGRTLKALSGKTLNVKVSDGKIYLNNVLLVLAGAAEESQYLIHTLSNFINQEQLPAITALSDEKTFPGWLLTIQGRNFSAIPEDNIVKFNGIQAKVHQATANELLVTVPSNALSGKITVTIDGKTVSSPTDVALMAAHVGTLSSMQELGITNIQGITIGPDDHLYFTDNSNNRVIGYSKTGETTIFEPLIQSNTDVNEDGLIDQHDLVSSLKNPWGIAVDQQGSVYCSVFGDNVGYIYKLNPESPLAAPELWAGSSDDYAPLTGPKRSIALYSGALTFDQSGNLIFNNGVYQMENGGDFLQKITPSGQVITLATPTQFKSVDPTLQTNIYINGIVTDNQGNSYITELFGKRIWKIGANGIQLLAGNNNAGAKDGIGTAAQFGSPYGLTIDQRGNLYVCDNDYDQHRYLVRMINPQGVVSTIAGGINANKEQKDGVGTESRFFGINAIAIGSKGQLYIGTDDGPVRTISIE